MDMEIEEQRDNLLSKSKLGMSPDPKDEVDFTSGFETQYRQEYAPKKPIIVPPPEEKYAWYRNWNTIFMIIFLLATFIIGTVALITKMFTDSPIKALIIVVGYVIIAILLLFLDVKSIHVR